MGEIIMDSFEVAFNNLLQAIPGSYTLQQWQTDYQYCIATMGQRILTKFPTAALGGPGKGIQPSGGPSKGIQPSGGPGKGVQPGAFATLVLGLPWDAPQ
jgi:hypothetical protein